MHHTEYPTRWMGPRRQTPAREIRTCVLPRRTVECCIPRRPRSIPRVSTDRPFSQQANITRRLDRTVTLDLDITNHQHDIAYTALPVLSRLGFQTYTHQFSFRVLIVTNDLLVVRYEATREARRVMRSVMHVCFVRSRDTRPITPASCTQPAVRMHRDQSAPYEREEGQIRIYRTP